MKKIALFLITALFILSAVLKPVKAQALTFDRAYQDYQFNLTLYNQSFTSFQNARNAYLANQTLSLKDDAKKATYTMLVTRDQLMVVYLTALRVKISELKGLTNDDKNNIFGKIDSEVNFYKDHKKSYHEGDDLSQLFDGSTKSENQYKNTTSLVVNEALFDISLGEVAGIRQSQEQIYSNLKKVINDRVAMGILKPDPFNHWFNDIEATDDTLKKNEDTAKSQI